tara:strand:- start:362 stop:499 length:138 start_codon:yes stop_codon:yes gene_type:complete
MGGLGLFIRCLSFLFSFAAFLCSFHFFDAMVSAADSELKTAVLKI